MNRLINAQNQPIIILVVLSMLLPLATRHPSLPHLTAWLDSFKRPSVHWPEPTMPHAPTDVESIIQHAANRYNLDPYLVKAVIKAESGFDHRAVSPKGAMGLMQLMPGTADYLGVNDPFDPYQNIMGGCRYLALQLKAFNSLPLALAAYNAGPGAITRTSKGTCVIPPYPETRRYVREVMGHYKAYRNSPA